MLSQLKVIHAWKIQTTNFALIWRIVRYVLTVGYVCVDQFGGFTKQGFFGVFDGHGGKDVADYCANRMSEVLLNLLKEASMKGVEKCLEETFVKVDGETRLLDSENTGSTACVAFITMENKEKVLYVANVGDSRAILVNTDGYQRLSYEHKATDPNELIRIQYLLTLLIENLVVSL